MNRKWSWKKRLVRLAGNWITAFFAPLAGGGIAITVIVADPNLAIILTALISATIITGVSLGKMLDEWSRREAKQNNSQTG